MAEEAEYNRRDYRGTRGAIEDAEGGGETRKGLPRGHSGGSKVKSPRRGVRDPGKPTEGSEGEPSYGAPISDSPEDRGEKD